MGGSTAFLAGGVDNVAARSAVLVGHKPLLSRCASLCPAEAVGCAPYRIHLKYTCAVRGSADAGPPRLARRADKARPGDSKGRTEYTGQRIYGDHGPNPPLRMLDQSTDLARRSKVMSERHGDCQNPGTPPCSGSRVHPGHRKDARRDAMAVCSHSYSSRREHPMDATDRLLYQARNVRGSQA